MKVPGACLLVSLAACTPPASDEPARAPAATASAVEAPASPAIATASADSPAAPSPTAAPPAAEQPAPATASSAPPKPGGAIEDLVSLLSHRPLWTNGSFPKIALPPSATTAEVVKRVFASVSFEGGRVGRHRIVEERVVQIGADPTRYRAVLLETDRGTKIVLLRAMGDDMGWWSRVFDPPH